MIKGKEKVQMKIAYCILKLKTSYSMFNENYNTTHK